MMWKGQVSEIQADVSERVSTLAMVTKCMETADASGI